MSQTDDKNNQPAQSLRLVLSLDIVGTFVNEVTPILGLTDFVTHVHMTHMALKHERRVRVIQIPNYHDFIY